MTTQLDFDEFVRARSDALVATAVLLCGDRHLAEDLVQTALAKAWRRRWNGERPTEALPERADDPVDLAGHVDLRDAIRRLPKRQRAVVVLRYFDDLSEAEIAQVMECSVGTVKSQAHRALRTLHTHLEQEQA